MLWRVGRLFLLALLLPRGLFVHASTAAREASPRSSLVEQETAFASTPSQRVPQHPMVGRVASMLDEYVKAPAMSMANALWLEADAAQQKLTTQLMRNSIYFFFSSVVIRYFGDYIAI
jgi:hypothetical protein